MTDVSEKAHHLFGAIFHIYSDLCMIIETNHKNNASSVFYVHQNPEKEVLHIFYDAWFKSYDAPRIRVAAILDLSNMAAPIKICLGALRK